MTTRPPSASWVRRPRIHLETTVRSGDIIGVSSWSATLLAMVDAMHPVNGVHDTQVVQILGGGGDPAAEGHATHLVRRMADLLHGEGTFLPAPSSVGSKASRDVLLEDPFVRRAMSLFDDLDVALVGIGGQEPSGLLTSSGNVFSEAGAADRARRGRHRRHRPALPLRGRHARALRPG